MILASHGIIGSSIGQVDADALAFFARVEAAGGTLSATERTAVNTLVVKMKFDGIWNSMKAIYPMVGASDAACKQNLKSSSFTGTFTSGWTFASTGVTTNNASTHFNTGLNFLTVFGVNFSSFGVYFRNTFTTGINLYGSFNGVQRCDSGYFNGSLNNFIAIGTNDSDNGTDTDSKGFFLSTRQGASVQKLFRNKILKVNGAKPFESYPNFDFFFGARNDSGTPLYLANNQNIAFAFIADNLTDVQSDKYYDAVQAFQTTLSRQV